MAGLPTVQVLLDDGTGTYPYDITAKARIGHTISRGRGDELSAVTAGQLTLTLDNTDGRFTPGSTIIASPSPIKADARIRVKETANGTTYTRFTGYVQSWPVVWPTGGQTLSEVTITATDAQARAERRTLKSALEEEVYLDGPFVHYTLAQPAGTSSVPDSSGNQQPALANAGSIPAVFGSTQGPQYTGMTAVDLVDGALLSASFTNPPSGAWSACVFFKTALPGTGTIAEIGLNRGLVIASGTATYNGVTLGSSLNDDEWHCFGVIVDFTDFAYYLVDGTVVSSGGTSGLYGACTGVMLGGGFVGSLSNVVVVGSALVPGQLSDYAHAGLTGFAGESDTARISRIRQYADLTAGTWDSTLSNVSAADLVGKSAQSAMQDAADADMGLVFINGSGDLTFHNRNRVVAKTAADVTVDADYLDPGTAFTTDTQGVINYFEATAAGSGNGAQVARDATSEDAHGRYLQSTTYLVQSDAEALDRANWIIATHKEPGPRAGTLALDLLTMTAAQQAQMLAIEPDHWISVTGLPSQTPGGTTANLVVQGLVETLAPDSWTLTLNVVDKATVYPNVWILGDSTYGVLDSTTRLYV
jgi:hypothetical protein